MSPITKAFVDKLRIDAVVIQSGDYASDLDACLAKDALALLDAYEKLDQRIRCLYSILAHGDATHRQWLEKTINEHFELNP